MTKPRVTETNVGIQEEMTVAVFDQFARDMRDKGWNGVEDMIATGINGGELLEIGPGPGYVGLEVAKQLGNVTLTGCEISPAMIRLARNNAESYRIPATYVEGNAMDMPLPDESFDNVISNGSLHEWEDPVRVFDEIDRVLRPGGRYCITDLRRDAALWKKWFVYLSTKPKAMRPGLLTSLHASYTIQEVQVLLQKSTLKTAYVKSDFFGLSIWGAK
ncbi:class I SAM-dependent methyltransferase [Zongyangia hominis]|uniref:Class I SAM-dependent methyltransferase n=1 Tax=Zongyangia hominis TaxID=2763677 RepID=A0A926ECW1_9FIRM|nr:class I SAM-dependent methyltransferase [Zongyangia hominis]MBC8569621.1 class I SAM-dependent methyltransferase [Zongyangia hominis]